MFMSTTNYISERALNIPKSAIHEMTRLSKQVDDVAFLSWAKPTSDTPSHIKDAAVKAIQDGKTAGYSETTGLYELREAIAKKLKSINGINATSDEVLVTIGAIEGLSAAILATVNPGEEVIIPVPGYSTHIRQVEIAGGIPVLVQTNEEEGFSLDLEAIEKAANKNTKAIVLSNPNNPTGAVYSEKELKELASIIKKKDMIAIIDEAYEYFTYEDNSHVSLATLPEMHDRVISVFTFTKTYAMTGWRIGYVHARRDWIPQMTKMHIPMAICAPVVSQYAALAALTGPQEYIEVFRDHYKTVREVMCYRLSRLDNIFDYQVPKGSYLMFPKIIHPDRKDSLKFAKKLLKDIAVSTTPGIAFHGEGHVRMSFCVPEEMVTKAFDRMENYFGMK